MLNLAILIASETTPTPSPTPTAPPDDLVTPGFGGFLVIALLVVAVVLLVWDMQRRIRRTRYRQEIGAELDAEELAARQAAAAVEASDVDDQATGAADSEPRPDQDDPDDPAERR